MNTDINNIYSSAQKKKEKSKGPKGPPSPANLKKQQIKAEKKLKENITSKPFNMGNIKNLANVKNDVPDSPIPKTDSRASSA
tara:strand:- start:2503 stop:2748 length:246 start_codon:yes stop_codon:yes gene_type:complete